MDSDSTNATEADLFAEFKIPASKFDEIATSHAREHRHFEGFFAEADWCRWCWLIATLQRIQVGDRG